MADKVEVGDHLLLDNQLCFALYDASRKMTHLYRPLLKELNLTYPQYLVLMVLWEHGKLTVNELGARLNLDSGTLTPLLKRMESNDFVIRRRADDDERKVFIALTEKGREISVEADKIPEQLVCKSGVNIERIFKLRDDIKEFIESLDMN